MQLAASTANLYPAPTEQALDDLLTLGFRTLEVFLNTESETEDGYLRDLRRRADAVGARIVSLHPYASLVEPYLLFSAYERRFRDGLRIYDRMFHAAAMLGADFLVLHGDREGGVLDDEAFAARYAALYDLGRTHGVTLLQENVVRFRACRPNMVRTMRQRLGDKARFVLDVKQCERAGVTVEEMIDAMGDAIAHVHISDCDDAHDCLPPGGGQRDFAALFRRLRDVGFDGAVTIELSRHNFGDPAELWDAGRYLTQFLAEK